MPNSASLDGALFGMPTNSVGEYGAISGPNTATSTISRTIPTPIRVRVIFSARLQDAQPRPLLDDRRAGAVRDPALQREVDGAVHGLAHRAAVLSLGVTMIVSTSAARLRRT